MGLSCLTWEHFSGGKKRFEALGEMIHRVRLVHTVTEPRKKEEESSAVGLPASFQISRLLCMSQRPHLDTSSSHQVSRRQHQEYRGNRRLEESRAAETEGKEDD